MSVTVTTPMNTYVFSSVAAPAINYNQVQLVLSTTTYHQIDYVAGDPLLNGGPLPPTSNGSVMSLGLYDSTRTAFASDSLSTTAPSLANFESAGWNLTGLTTGGVAVYGFNADITSITAVPEPEIMAVLAAIGLASLAIWRRTRRTQ